MIKHLLVSTLSVIALTAPAVSEVSPDGKMPPHPGCQASGRQGAVLQSIMPSELVVIVNRTDSTVLVQLVERGWYPLEPEAVMTRDIDWGSGGTIAWFYRDATDVPDGEYVRNGNSYEFVSCSDGDIKLLEVESMRNY